MQAHNWGQTAPSDQGSAGCNWRGNARHPFLLAVGLLDVWLLDANMDVHVAGVLGVAAIGFDFQLG
jgi:hypothetical protein